MADLDIAELLRQQLAGGANVQDTLGELAQSDPQLAPIAQLLAQREAKLQEELERQEQEEQLELDEEDRLAERRARAGSLRAHLAEITAELESIRARFGAVAGALGACPACFGDDTGCAWCHGRGAPGFMPPDPVGFDRLVMPALRLHVRLHGRPITHKDSRPTPERNAS